MGPCTLAFCGPYMGTYMHTTRPTPASFCFRHHARRWSRVIKPRPGQSQAKYVRHRIVLRAWARRVHSSNGSSLTLAVVSISLMERAHGCCLSWLPYKNLPGKTELASVETLGGTYGSPFWRNTYIHTIEYTRIQYNTIEHHRIQQNTTEYNRIQQNTLEYNRIPYNTIEYNRIQ